MEFLVMNEQERLAKAVMEMVTQRQIKLRQAADQLDISYRQVKRLYRRYKLEGDAGLVHKGRGRESNRRHPQRETIIARYQQK